MSRDEKILELSEIISKLNAKEYTEITEIVRGELKIDCDELSEDEIEELVSIVEKWNHKRIDTTTKNLYKRKEQIEKEIFKN